VVLFYCLTLRSLIEWEQRPDIEQCDQVSGTKDLINHSLMAHGNTEEMPKLILRDYLCLKGAVNLMNRCKDDEILLIFWAFAFASLISGCLWTTLAAKEWR